MTKQVEFLLNESCGKCARIKQQAEDAFRELRTQADLHIAAVERKLEAERLDERDFEGEIRRLKAENAHLRGDSSDIRGQVNAIASEYQGRIAEMEAELLEVENRARIELEHSTRKHKKEIRNLEMRVAELEAQLAAKEHEDSAASRWSIEKAKLDLAYRKRIGEMESEVRRTEIESVRLRKQILSLTQQLKQEEDGGRFRSLLEPEEHFSGRIAKISSRIEDVQ